ncbi:hypothetical protein [Haloarcula marina]|uniref:hypothetical protein n=1 Tax=Haloarcula marina TaxID=2961574 RepID=UPI0020B898E8|nr:hypothetical protein [Halomicroarcula marina]
MDEPVHAAAGTRRWRRLGKRNSAAVFALVGVGLVAAAVAVPAFETILFVWGGTALFVALLLRFVTTGATVRATAATDVYATFAGNARRLAGTGPQRYVPDGDAVSLVVGEADGQTTFAPVVGEADGQTTFAPVGERLTAAVPGPATDAAPGDRLAVLVDALVNDLELVESATARTTESGAEVTVTDSYVGTAELFDHPVASVLGVGLARALDAPVTVESTAEGDRLVVTCRWDS